MGATVRENAIIVTASNLQAEAVGKEFGNS
jgi:hypothetical protein